MGEKATVLIRAELDLKFEQLYRIYKLELESSRPDYLVENVRFVHDPRWRERWTSVQGVGDVQRGLLRPLQLTASYVEGRIFWAAFAAAEDWTRKAE